MKQRQSYYTVRYPIAVGMHFLDVAPTLPRQAFLGIFRAFILHTRAEVVRVFVVVAVKRTTECLSDEAVLGVLCVCRRWNYQNIGQLSFYATCVRRRWNYYILASKYLQAYIHTCCTTTTKPSGKGSKLFYELICLCKINRVWTNRPQCETDICTHVSTSPQTPSLSTSLLESKGHESSSAHNSSLQAIIVAQVIYTEAPHFFECGYASNDKFYLFTLPHMRTSTLALPTCQRRCHHHARIYRHGHRNYHCPRRCVGPRDSWVRGQSTIMVSNLSKPK